LAIYLTKHFIVHGRSKHIKTRFDFLGEQVNKGKLKLEYCKIEKQLADIFRKALKSERFRELRVLLAWNCMC